MKDKEIITMQARLWQTYELAVSQPVIPKYLIKKLIFAIGWTS
jgi:hypothetical protein